MGTSVGPNISSNGLVFGYDTGYPIVDNDNSTIFSKGEPASNLIPNIGTSVSNWAEYGWSGDWEVSSDYENTFELTATNGWHNTTYDYEVSSGNVNVSFEYRLKSKQTSGIYGFVLNGTHLGSYTNHLGNITNPSLSEWKSFSANFTGNSTSTKIALGVRGTDSAGLTDVLYIRNLQVESSDNQTPFINGTRSSTQSLIDLKETTNIDVSNASFDSNARLSFDGTDDVITAAGLGISNYSEPFSMECVFKVPTSGTWANNRKSNVFSIAGSYAGQYGIFKESTDTIGFQIRDASTGGYCTSTGHSKDVYHHVIITFGGGSGMKLYINGELKSSNTTSFTGTPDSTNLYIGGKRAFGGSDGSFFEGEIPITKYYSIELTSAEIANKFNSIRKRFGI